MKLTFLANMAEKVVALQPQKLLHGIDYCDPFQTDFGSGYGIETDLVTLVDGKHDLISSFALLSCF